MATPKVQTTVTLSANANSTVSVVKISPEEFEGKSQLTIMLQVQGANANADGLDILVSNAVTEAGLAINNDISTADQFLYAFATDTANVVKQETITRPTLITAWVEIKLVVPSGADAGTAIVAFVAE